MYNSGKEREESMETGTGHIYMISDKSRYPFYVIRLLIQLAAIVYQN